MLWVCKYSSFFILIPNTIISTPYITTPNIVPKCFVKKEDLFMNFSFNSAPHHTWSTLLLKLYFILHQISWHLTMVTDRKIAYAILPTYLLSNPNLEMLSHIKKNIWGILLEKLTITPFK